MLTIAFNAYRPQIMVVVFYNSKVIDDPTALQHICAMTQMCEALSQILTGKKDNHVTVNILVPKLIVNVSPPAGVMAEP